MNIRRRTKNIIAALLAMVLCLTGFLPLSGMQTVRAEEKEAKIWFKDSEDNADSGKATFVSDKGGIVYASIEKFTVGQGYLSSRRKFPLKPERLMQISSKNF